MATASHEFTPPVLTLILIIEVSHYKKHNVDMNSLENDIVEILVLSVFPLALTQPLHKKWINAGDG